MADFMPLDEQTRRVIDSRVNAAAELGGPVDPGSSGLLPQFNPSPTNFDKMGFDGAIANKYNSVAEREIQKIKDLNNLNAPRRQMKKLMSAADLASKDYRYNYQQQMALRQRIMQEESQRAQLLGSMLGIGGMIAGGMIGGAPGAAVGGQVGQMAGGAAAGGNKSGIAQRMEA